MFRPAPGCAGWTRHGPAPLVRQGGGDGGRCLGAREKDGAGWAWLLAAAGRDAAQPVVCRRGWMSALSRWALLLSAETYGGGGGFPVAGDAAARGAAAGGDCWPRPAEQAEGGSG